MDGLYNLYDFIHLSKNLFINITIGWLTYLQKVASIFEEENANKLQMNATLDHLQKSLYWLYI